MQTITEMIAAAQERQEKQAQAHRQEQAERNEQALRRAIDRTREIFGAEILELLGVRFERSEYGAPHILFHYQGVEYSMREHNEACVFTIIRLDPRDEDDERPRPRDNFYFQWREQEDNRDRLLLTLVELAAAPEIPPMARQERQERQEELAPPPTIEERLVEALRALIRAEVPNSTYY